jgi:hypothetical protein
MLVLCIGNNNEYFTNDEAIQNIASLYNASNFEITNAKITGALTANTANVINLATPTANITTLTAPTTNVTNFTTSNAIINSLTAPTANITNMNNTNANINNLTSPNANITTLTNTTGNINNLNVGGFAKFRIRSGVQPADGWDVGSNMSATDINNCANQCFAFPSALIAGFSKNDRRCYCKTNISLYNYQNAPWDTAIFI